jgi:hypothetical protein
VFIALDAYLSNEGQIPIKAADGLWQVEDDDVRTGRHLS